MSQFATTAHSNPIIFGGRKKAIKSKPIPPSGTSRVTLTFVLVVLICAMGVFYIFEVNNVATQGYAIRDLEKQAQDLRNNNEKLKIKEAELRSMYNIEERTKDLNMTAPKDVSYMALPGNVAMK
jgi:cell division protein FtsL